MTLLRLIPTTLLALALCACTPIVAKRGNTPEESQLKQIVVGTTTREEAAKILGTPTETSTFDDKVWYYIGRRTEQEAFLDPVLVEETIIRVEFTPDGKVASITKGGSEFAQNIDPVSRKTPTYGKDISVMQQLLGNLGKPTIPSPTKK
jgi:outer membrane protein assembly factor BamE (lipoprotein component of BamABCDE complex)